MPSFAHRRQVFTRTVSQVRGDVDVDFIFYDFAICVSRPIESDSGDGPRQSSQSPVHAEFLDLLRARPSRSHALTDGVFQP